MRDLEARALAMAHLVEPARYEVETVSVYDEDDPDDEGATSETCGCAFDDCTHEDSEP
jgi:hypothetical protein